MSREPTGPTKVERYDAEPLPPTPFVDRWHTPWAKIALLAFAVSVVVSLAVVALVGLR